ncbi:cytochrome-c peroxidase [Gynuella sp.]|uniref:cytochrome-c peroxidase n=1 Tax=Gynuella sp. TaxID=2969146 RepID=UPI003D140D34
MPFKFPNKHSAVLISLLSLGVVSQAATNEPIQPIKAPAQINTGQAELGKKLYFDPRLSKSGYISCNSCHNLSMGGTDNITSSIGDHWQQGPINAPTVLNASMNLAQFWDGRAEDLKDQAGGPIANPKEMASNHTLAIEVLKSIPQYVVEFKQVFNSDQITIDQVTTAIAEFEKTLVTPGSRFDQWLEGDKTALNDTELSGYELFKSSGCTACHNGPAVGGTMYQKVGVIKPYQTNNPALGRFDVTGNEADKNVFKVPTLRNIELTYPYFHDGAIKTLSEAVNTMGEIQLGKTFNATENTQLVAFLKTLTGEQPQITLPILPPSNDNTPQPQPFK